MIRILARHDLPRAVTGSLTSTVGEPSLALAGGQILYTGNWYAAKSPDDGSTWLPLDPFTFFAPADEGFCCDQTALYDPTRDLFFWVLQYRRGDHRNTMRLAVKRGATLEDDSDWVFWDFVPDQVDPEWSDEWFDFNHAALSDNFLYLVTNTFTTSTPAQFTRCVAFRIRLDDLAAGADPAFEHFQTNSFSLRATQGATDAMYFGTHVRTAPARIRLFRWAESDAGVTSVDVPVTAWRGGNGYFAPGPDDRNWLGRCDPRITGGWIRSGVLGFLWTVDRMGTRPHPHVRVARIRESDFTLLDEPDIWSREVAFAFADAGVNGDGELGIALFFGGRTVAPSHAVGAWDDAAERWELRASRNGTDGPSDGKWGDYVTCRPGHPVGRTWAASGFVLDGGGDPGSVRPFVVRFSR